jgi:AcrR family transcriptional regulator
MSTTAPTGSAPVTRRQAYRQATIEEIKSRARQQLAEHGPSALSLRAIARDMRMASSALYRYFASYDELISALVVDSYHGVADALAAARDARPAGDPAGQWWAICHGYRRWARDHPSDFALIFGTPVPGYRAPTEVVSPAAGRFAAVWVDAYTAAVQAKAARPEHTQVPADVQPGELAKQLLPQARPDRVGGIVLSAWASLLGFLVVEVLGGLTRLVSDPDQLYEAHVRIVMLGVGFDRDLVEAIGQHHEEP